MKADKKREMMEMKRPRGRHGNDADEEVPAKKKKRRNSKEKDPQPTPELPVMFRKRIEALGGYNVSFVIEKTLFQTDVSAGHNRLSVPLNQIKQTFLTLEEDARLDSGKHHKKCADLKVMLIEPSLRRSIISLRKWDMKKSSGTSNSVYVLVSNWNSVAWRNAMRENEKVQLWSFRINRKLCFALVKRRDRVCFSVNKKESSEGMPTEFVYFGKSRCENEEKTGRW